MSFWSVCCIDVGNSVLLLQIQKQWHSFVFFKSVPAFQQSDREKLTIVETQSLSELQSWDDGQTWAFFNIVFFFLNKSKSWSFKYIILMSHHIVPDDTV